MNRRSRVVLLGALLVPVLAVSSVVAAVSIDELTRRSPLVVHGEVRRVGALANASGQIWTYAEISVSEVLRGATDQPSLVVKQPGGVLGAVGQSVAGAATFTAGEEVVLFLEPATDEQHTFVTMGLSLGKVTLEVQRGARVAVRHLDGLSLVHADTGRPERVDTSERLGAAEVFLRRVRAAARVAP